MPLHSDCISIVRKGLDEITDLFLPDLFVLDEPSLFVLDQPVLQNIRIEPDLFFVRHHVGEAGADHIVEVHTAGYQLRVIRLGAGRLVGIRNLLRIDHLLIAGSRVADTCGELIQIDRTALDIRNDHKFAVCIFRAVPELNIGVLREDHILFLQFGKSPERSLENVGIISAPRRYRIMILLQIILGPESFILILQKNVDAAVGLIGETHVFSTQRLRRSPAEADVHDIILCRDIKPSLRLIRSHITAVVPVDRRPRHEMRLAILIAIIVDPAKSSGQDQERQPESQQRTPFLFLFFLLFGAFHRRDLRSGSLDLRRNALVFRGSSIGWAALRCPGFRRGIFRGWCF